MASKRLAKSMVDWAAFAERVPPNQRDIFRAFKAKSDVFVSKVHKYPENLPKIDFANYRNRIAAPGMVDEFEKAYAAVSVPVPKDKSNKIAEIAEQEKAAQAQSQEYVNGLKKSINEAQQLLAKISSVPALDEMTHEMYGAYFPDMARNPATRPTFWPHNKSSQPEGDAHNLN